MRSGSTGTIRPIPITSISNVIITKATAGRREAITKPRFSKRSGGEPPLDLLEPVMAPEGLAVDEKEGGAEHTALQGRVDRRFQALLDVRLLDRRQRLVRVGACLPQYVRQHGSLRDVASCAEVRAERRVDERPGARAVGIAQPDK